VYAYEVDGLGNHLLMDDANIPSLLSMAYLGFTSAEYDRDQAIANNTRQFVLSAHNPYFFSGSQLQGIGSPHTQPRFVWPMSIIIKVLAGWAQWLMVSYMAWY
jgi:uncharacterized protein